MSEVRFNDFGRKLGKAPARKDLRTIRFSSVLKSLPAVPAEYDFDEYTGARIPLPMFANDKYGDCVIAGRANQTLRFESVEQGKVLPITDDDVLREYWRESGGKGPDYDNGLVLMESLRIWRTNGWTVGDKVYNIHAFAKLNRGNRTEVKAGIFLLHGLQAGIQLPKSADGQFSQGLPWDVVYGPDGAYGSEGGHLVYLVGYNAVGPVCVTWAKKQQMTWDFLSMYCDELFGIVDDKNRFMDSVLDVEKLEGYLREIEK